MIVSTDYSLFKSSIKLSKAIELASPNGFLVLADNNLNAVPKFVFGCRKEKIKPIIGVLKKTELAEYLFIALNNEGYKELLYAETKGYTFSIFKSKNILPILNNIFDEKKAYLPKYAFRRSSNYINSKEDKYNKLIENSDISILSPMIINSTKEEEHFVVSALDAIGTKRYMEEKVFETYSNFNPGYNDEVFLSIIDNIEDFSQFGDPCPPEFKFKQEVANSRGLNKDNITDSELFEYLVMEGLKDRFEGCEVPQEYIDRVKVEIKVIQDMKFSGYFLIVWDFINYAKENNIPVGPGRGSAAGACIAWALKITNIDPIKNGLIFERFLNPDRVSFPDIDIDFCQSRRQEVIDYVVNKYGEDSVAQVITFGTIKAKGAVNDAARVQQVPDYLAQKISKEISDKPDTTLLGEYSSNPTFWDKWKNEDYFVSKTLDLAFRIEGYVRNHGIHAGAVVISNQPIYEKAPVYMVGEDKKKEGSGTRAIGFEGKYLEEADLVKYDFLGLKTLTVIDLAIKNIKEAYNVDIDLDSLEVTDNAIYDYISLGDTRGLFQIESEGMMDLAKKLKPSNFDDVTAMLALYRPGPMEAGMLDSFVERKHGREKVDYFFDSMEEVLKPILEPTYGMIVYQEQVMQIVRVIAGFSLGQSDLVRRAMGKKDAKEMENAKKGFVEGAYKNGYKKEEALELFNLIEKFAEYGFNKSHSAAYAQVTYYTAFLKYYYPAEFMTALIQLEINSAQKNLDKVAFYIEEAKRMGIEVIPPSIETSSLEFKTKEGKIYYGLKGIKSVGEGVQDLVNAYKEHYNGDILNFLWNLQSDHSVTLGKLEKKKETISNKIPKLKETIQKNIDTLNRKIASKEKKISTLNSRIGKLKEKATNMGHFDLNNLNDRDKASYEKAINEIAEVENDLMLLQSPEASVFPSHGKLEEAKLELENISREIEFLKKNKIDLPKIKKSDFEGLASVGALEVLGVSRKFLLENMADLLNPKTVLGVSTEEKNIDYSMAEKIPLEMKFIHTVITSPFGDNLKDYQSLDLPEGMYITTILSKTEKRKKDGKTYISAILKTVNNETYEVGDFQNRLKDKNIGDVFVSMIKINGKYANLQKVSSVKNVFDIYEKKKKVLKINIFEDLPAKMDYDVVEVYDNSSFVMRLFK